MHVYVRMHHHMQCMYVCTPARHASGSDAVPSMRQVQLCQRQRQPGAKGEDARAKSQEDEHPHTHSCKTHFCILLKNVLLSAVLGPLAAVSSKITSIMQIAELTVTFDSKGALSCSYKCRLKLFLQARPAIELLFGLLR